MPENNNIDKKPYLEIEIYYFKRIVEKCNNVLIKTIIFFKKRFLYFISSAIIGIIIGYSYFAICNYTIYETRLIVNSNVVSSNLIVDLIDNLNSSGKNNEKVCLSEYSRIFKINSQEATQIIKIKAVELNKVDSMFKDSIPAERVLIKIQVKDNSISNKISNGIISHIENNKFIDTNYTIISQKLSKIENAIHYNIIDTTKQTVNVLASNKNVISPDLLTDLFVKEYNTWATNKLLSKISVIDSIVVEKNSLNLKNTLLLFVELFIALSFVGLFMKYIIQNPKFKE